MLRRWTDKPPPRSLKGSALKHYSVAGYEIEEDDCDLQFVQYARCDEVDRLCGPAIGNATSIPVNFPLNRLAEWLTRDELKNMAKIHNLSFRAHDNKTKLKLLFANHSCTICNQYVSIFRSIDGHLIKRIKDREYKRASHQKNNKSMFQPEEQKSTDEPEKTDFPPAPLSSAKIEQVVNDFCADTDPVSLKESGCMVCRQLKSIKELEPVSKLEDQLALLQKPGVTRRERSLRTDLIEDIKGPVIDSSCKCMCSACFQLLQKGKVPKHALANGLWLGKVPDELKGLTFSERMMIARVHHNRAIVRVSSNRAKMIANVIMYSSPVLKVYHALPPSQAEMKEVLAFIFTGSTQPTDDDFKRTPLLVR